MLDINTNKQERRDKDGLGHIDIAIIVRVAEGDTKKYIFAALNEMHTALHRAFSCLVLSKPLPNGRILFGESSGSLASMIGLLEYFHFPHCLTNHLLSTHYYKLHA